MGYSPIETMFGSTGRSNAGSLANTQQSGFLGTAPGYGSDPYAQGMNNYAQQNANQTNRYGGTAFNELLRGRGPQAIENQQLSDREAYSRGYDQSGAVRLAREAAMGQAPSEAAYLMQSGLNQGMANQQAVTGGARGANAMAMSQGNMGGNVSNMQQQAYNQAGALRANEMGQARGLYGGLANTMREQDQARLQMGNQMSQFNAGLNDQYRLGMGGLANQFSNTGANWFGQGNQALQGAAGIGANVYGTQAGVYNQGAKNLMDWDIQTARGDIEKRGQDMSLVSDLAMAAAKAVPF